MGTTPKGIIVNTRKTGLPLVLAIVIALALIAGTAGPASAASVKSKTSLAKAVDKKVRSYHGTGLKKSACVTRYTKAAAKSSAKRKSVRKPVRTLKSQLKKRCRATSIVVLTSTKKSSGKVMKSLRSSSSRRKYLRADKFDKLATSAYGNGKRRFTVVSLVDTTRAVRPQSPPAQPPADVEVIKTEVLAKVNAERALAGAPALVRNACLDGYAQGWANKMQQDHRNTSSDKVLFTHPTTAAQQAEYIACLPPHPIWGNQSVDQVVAGTVSWQGNVATAATAAWMASPSHKVAILDGQSGSWPHLAAGVGVSWDSTWKRWVVVLDLGQN